MARVKAIARGFDGIQIREPGEVFDFAGPIGKWMIPLDKSASLATEKDSSPKRGGKRGAKKIEEPGEAAVDEDASDDQDLSEE